jgi:hypothetical protein
MSKNLFAALAAVGATLGGLAAAVPASAAVQFAVFRPEAGKLGGVVNFKDDGKGVLESVTPSTATIFTFKLTPLSDFGALQSTFNFKATQDGAASLSGGEISAMFDGSFNYYYAGKTITKDGITLTKGDLLLHGSFTDASFTGVAGASGANLHDDTMIGKVTYTFSSAIPHADLPPPANPSFTLGFIDISKILAIQTKGKYAGDLRDFQTIGSGQFSSEVPEPASLTLLLTGFGLMGGALRRRARRSASVIAVAG